MSSGTTIKRVSIPIDLLIDEEHIPLLFEM
jgi:hypothetical protein